MWVGKLLKEFGRILDAVDAKVQVIDVLITGPHARWFAGRISPVRREREVGLCRSNSGLTGRGLICCGPGRARPNEVESKNRTGQSDIDDGGSQIAARE